MFHFVAEACADDVHQADVCPYYKMAGFCKVDPPLMKKHCKKTCGFCRKFINANSYSIKISHSIETHVLKVDCSFRDLITFISVTNFQTLIVVKF